MEYSGSLRRDAVTLSRQFRIFLETVNRLSHISEYDICMECVCVRVCGILFFVKAAYKKHQHLI
jgi:hypothetical protein